MIRYYQVDGPDGRGTWKPIEDSPDIGRKINEIGASRYSILAINQEVLDDGTTEQGSLRHTGPWYADIDNPDLDVSIVSTRELVQKLIDAEIPEEAISVFCSGSKGFHVMVDSKIFREKAGKALTDQPYIYRELAVGFFVIGMDFQVYSGGRGRMWRPNNALRPDGKYRVRVSIEEPFGMTVPLYHQYVSDPGNIAWADYHGGTVPSQAVRFKTTTKRAKKKTETKEGWCTGTCWPGPVSRLPGGSAPQQALLRGLRPAPAR